MKATLNIFAVIFLAMSLAGCGGKVPESHADEKGHAHDDGKGHEKAEEHKESEGHQEGDRHEGKEGEGEGGHDETLKLTPEARKAAGLEIVTAGATTLVETVPLYGVVKPNAERVRSVTARFPGVVRAVSVKVGDSVRVGQSLASVESNESLQVYAVTSPLAGVVTERATNPGERAESAALFTVADLSTVWVELSLFPRDRSRVQLGQEVRVSVADGDISGDGKIVFISPLGTGATQTITARVLLDNAAGLWAPGLYVRADVAAARTEVALGVPASALQELEETGQSVFVETADGFAPKSVKTGRNDGKVVEIVSGLEAGARVVAEGSFVLKAEQGKGAAEHGH
jgi:cobalt-zinc-cadmium efflux system membrane fusion protein